MSPIEGHSIIFLSSGRSAINSQKQDYTSDSEKGIPEMYMKLLDGRLLSIVNLFDLNRVLNIFRNTLYKNDKTTFQSYLIEINFVF